MKGYIFDLDGVLTDTAKFHYLAWKETADQLGISFSLADNENLKGISRRQSLEWILTKGNIQLSEDQKLHLMTDKNNRYLERIKELSDADLLPGLPEYLHLLKYHNKKIILGSSSKNATAILQRLGILHLFDALVDGNQITHAKPDPEVFLKGAQKTGLLSRECIVFEDAEAGIAAAHAAGMMAVGVGISPELHDSDIIITGFDTPEAIHLISR